MSKTVLDASAILAVIFTEPGAEKLTDEILDDSIASTVNLAEVQRTLVRKGYDPDAAWEDALSFAAPADYTPAQAKTAGTLIRETSRLGLSLGDRSCLALAMALGAEVYTTEKQWKNLKLGVAIHVIR